jgi:phosphoserine phosphatase
MNRFNKSLLGLVAISASSSVSVGPVLVQPSPTSMESFLHGTANITNGTKICADSKRVHEAKEIIKTADIICFDVDSTVIVEEGIDELADYCGKGQEVANLTKEAMGGSMTFQEALRKRLDIIRPSQKQIYDFLAARPSTLSNGISDFIQYLKTMNKKIYLISGGFDCLIEPVAVQLGIPLQNLFANKLLFDYKGEYVGFDTTQLTSRSGGKGEAIQQIRQFNQNRLMTHGPRLKVIMIGDGATDLEASPPADHFIGYGGNIVRESVRDRASHFVTDFKQLF